MLEENPYRLYYVYDTVPIAMGAAAGAVGQAQLSISSDANFEAKSMTVTVEQVGLIVVNWGGTLQIEDSGSGRTLFLAPVLVEHVRGNGQFPYLFDPPRCFLANTTVTVTCVNSVAVATNVQVAIHGNKLLPNSAAAGLG